MAVVLERLLSEKMTTREVLEWLISDSGKIKDSRHCEVLQDAKLQTEFLPYFINSLRDQTAHLVCRGSSSVSSPARTPSSLQKLKRAPQNRPQRSGGSKVNRTQLFASEKNKSSRSERDLNSVPALTSDGRGLISPHTPPLGRREERLGKNVAWSGGGDSGSRRKTPGSGSRKDDPVTLAQFLITPENNSRGRGRKSPFGDGNSDKAPSHKGSSNKRRSGGKGRAGGQSEGSGSRGSRLQQVDKPPVFDLGSPQEFPPMGATTPKLVTPRRITPTTVSSSSSSPRRITTFPSPAPATQSENVSPSRLQTNISSCPSDSTNKTTNASSDAAKNSLEKERELLKQERLRQKAQQENSAGSNQFSPGKLMQSPRAISLGMAVTPTKLMRSNSVSSMTDVVPPDVEKVSRQDKLDLLAELYASCLKESLVPNLAVELYFLVQLLTAKGSKADEEEGIKSLEDDIEDVNYLSSIHNCVYFAASVLSRLTTLLSLLDKSSLRLLAENSVVSQFSPILKNQLDEIIVCCPLESRLQAAITSPMQVVPFLADTDNRKHFPTDGSFHSFKKHRDGFYGLVREWEEHHNRPEWKMQEKLTHRIRDLVRHMDITNYTHFSRLFQSQLIKMCQGDTSVIDTGDSQELSFIQHLRRTNPGKFKRLEDRFSNPVTSGGPSPPPSFHGCQEFFRNFILAADSYTFNQHLIDSFATEVTELNDFQLGISDQADLTSLTIDAEHHDSFSSCLLALRVLAKFLGFLVFLPYRGEDTLPDTMKGSVVAMRSKAPLSVDLVGYLVRADASQRLILTLPWVVEYLSMMDALAAQIDHYHQALSQLADVHKRVSVQWAENPHDRNLLLILLLLGWLFENPALPSNLHLSSGVNVQKGSHGNKPGSDQSLDLLPLIDRHVLYTCCPFLGSLRGLLSEASLGMSNRSAPVKKITPVAVDESQPLVISENQIQMELEKNFFHNHSTSLKKSVEFVSGRLASNCIKSIDSSLVSDARLRVPKMLTELLAACSSSSKKESGGLVAKASKQVGEKLSRETVELARTQAKIFLEERSRAALEVLLPCDTSPTVLHTACAITRRLALDRAEKWITAQIPGALQQEIASQLPKCQKAQSGQVVKKDSEKKRLPDRPDTHARDSQCPSAIIQQLKDCVRGVLMQCQSTVNLAAIHSTLSDVQSVINNRQDLTPLAFQAMHQLTVELCVALVAQNPSALQLTCPHTTPRQTRTATNSPKHCHASATLLLGDKCTHRVQTAPSDQDLGTSSSTKTLECDKPEEINQKCNKESGRQSCLGGCEPGKQCNIRERVEKEGTCTSSGSDDAKELLLSQTGDHVPCGQTCVNRQRYGSGDEVAHQSLMERLVAMWRTDFSLTIPVEAFLSVRTAWMISYGDNPQESWQCLCDVTQHLLASKLVSVERVLSSVGKMMMSQHIQPITEETAQLILPLVTSKAIGPHEQAKDALVSVCQEAMEKEDAYS